MFKSLKIYIVNCYVKDDFTGKFLMEGEKREAFEAGDEASVPGCSSSY
jgi:hypothetical protein